jgi:hypothetical protein
MTLAHYSQAPAYEGEAPLAKAGELFLAEGGPHSFVIALLHDVFDWDGVIKGTDEEGELVTLYGHNWTFEPEAVEA